MTQEEIDFQFFKDNQLHFVDFGVGRLDVWVGSKTRTKARIIEDVGSLNQDGYERVRCKGTLRMKHRLLFWLFHGYLPKEIDHEDRNRSNNGIHNLKASTRSGNTKDKSVRSYKQLTEVRVRKLCKQIAQGTKNITELANDFGRSRTQIKAIMSKKYWKEISDQYF